MFSSLHCRNYRLWFFGQTVSQSGTWMQTVAQSALVLFGLHGSALDLGITTGLQFGPVLVLGPVGGLLVDRFDKRKLLLLTQTALIAQALALAVLVASGVANLWMVWLLAFAMGVIYSVDQPARQSFVVEMVGPEDIVNAVGLNNVIFNASRIVGPAIAGVFLVTMGMAWTFALNAASYVAVLAALLAMRASELYRQPPVPGGKGQIREGLHYAWGAWRLRVPLLMMAVVATLAFNYSVILPLFATVFAGGAGTYSAMTTAMGIGALVGALAVASCRRPGYRLLVLVTLVFGAATVVTAAAPSLPLMLALLAPTGAASVVFVATTNYLLQLHTSDAMRGRVMALWSMVSLGFTPIGGPLTGTAAAHLGARWAMALGGVAVLLTAGAAALALRKIGEERGLSGAAEQLATKPTIGRLAEAEASSTRSS
jgi:MFS family permease